MKPYARSCGQPCPGVLSLTEEPLEGFALLSLRHDLIAGQARRETTLLTDDTTDEAHSILELEVVALYDSQIEALLLAACRGRW